MSENTICFQAYLQSKNYQRYTKKVIDKKINLKSYSKIWKYVIFQTMEHFTLKKNS